MARIGATCFRIGTGLSPEISALATMLVVGMIVVSAASERLG